LIVRSKILLFNNYVTKKRITKFSENMATILIVTVYSFSL